MTIIIPEHIPDDIRQLIFDWSGIYLPWSKSTYNAGCRRFDFSTNILKDTEYIIDEYIKVRDLKKINKIKNLYKGLRLKFEKTIDHINIENITGIKWEDLCIKKKIHINGVTRENTKISQDVNKDFVDSWYLPSIICQLTNLKELGITESTCIGLPESIGHLKNLNELWFTDNDYNVDIPNSIGKLKKLNKLSFEVYKKIPKSISKLYLLEELYLYGNANIPDLSSLKQLKVLCIQYKKWEKGILPDWIGKLLLLEDLDLSHCNIKKIPKTLIDLNIESLNLSDNKIESLPDWFNYIKSDKIYISYNRLEQLPNNFSNLDYQTDLITLYGNPLRILPRNISKLKNRVDIIIEDGTEEGNTNLCQQDIKYLSNFKNNYSF